MNYPDNLVVGTLLILGIIATTTLLVLKDQPYYRETRTKSDWTVKAYALALFLFSWITFLLMLVKNS